MISRLEIMILLGGVILILFGWIFYRWFDLFKHTEFRMKVDAGHSFIYPGDNSGGVADTIKSAGSALASGLSDLVDITVDTDTAACDVEVFVGSA